MSFINKNYFRIIILFCLLLGFVLFYYFDINQLFSFQQIKEKQLRLEIFYKDYPTQSSLIFFLIYTLATTLLIPITSPMTVIAGVMFGLPWGAVIVSLASTLGSIFSFLIARFILFDKIQALFSTKLETINKNFDTSGTYYLLFIRLIPIIPFLLVNILIAITPIRTLNFFYCYFNWNATCNNYICEFRFTNKICRTF